MKNLKLLLSCVIILTASILTGCNTIHGAGEDLQAGGKALTKSANENKSPPKSTDNNY